MAFWLMSLTLMPTTIDNVRQLFTSGRLNSDLAAYSLSKCSGCWFTRDQREPGVVALGDGAAGTVLIDVADGEVRHSSVQNFRGSVGDRSGRGLASPYPLLNTEELCSPSAGSRNSGRAGSWPESGSAADVTASVHVAADHAALDQHRMRNCPPAAC